MTLLREQEAQDEPGLGRQIHRGKGRRPTVPSQPQPEQPPPPTFRPPPVGSPPRTASGGGAGLGPTLAAVAGALQNPAVQQVLGLVLGGVQQAATALEAAPLPRPLAFTLPTTGQAASQPQGIGGLEPTLAAVVGALQNPAVQQLLGLLVGGARQAATMLSTAPTPGSDQPGQSLRSAANGGTGLTGQVQGGNGQNLTSSSPSGPAQAAPGSTPGSPGAANLQPALAALMGALQNPAVQQLLGLLLRGARYAATALTSLSVPSGTIAGWGAPTSATGVYDATLGEANQATAEVSTNEMRRILEQGSAAVVDGRTALEYAIGHIPGAVNVAPKPGVAMSLYVSDVAEISRQVASKDAPVVVYCNGPFCGKSRRLGEELVQAGFTNVRRYQLGTPVWRALVGMMAIEPAGISYVLKSDRTAAFIDARAPAEYALGSVPQARNVPVGQLIAAKDDGRLPMDDFNTRVIVFGRDGAQARTMAQSLVEQGFTNVKFFDGAFTTLVSSVS